MGKKIICCILFLFAVRLFPQKIQAAVPEMEKIADVKQESAAAVSGSAVEIGRMQVKVSVSSYTKKKLKISWKHVKNASQYEVLVKKGEQWETAKKTGQTSARIKIDAYGTKQCYLLRAADENGNMIASSKQFHLLLPPAVSGLRTTSYANTKVILSWNQSKGAKQYQVRMKAVHGNYKLVGTGKKTSLKVNVAEGENYVFQVIPIYKNTDISLKGKASSVSFSNQEIVSLGHQNYTYEEMCADMKALQKKYHGYVSYQSIGKSEQNREIYDVILGNPHAKKTLLVVSAIHAREYVTTVVCMRQLEYYLSNYNKTLDGRKVADVFQKCCIHYIMMANPDGVVISQTGDPNWKGNVNGINLNRNFPDDFQIEGSIASNDYSGKYAASEKETKAIIKITKRLAREKELAVVNYHAMGNIVFGDYDGKDDHLRGKIRQLYEVARNTTGYADAAGYSGSSHGNYRGYLSNIACIPSITIEVGSTACPVSYRYYPSICQCNRLVILREAALVCGW